ncbi:hypothetical protein CAI21_02965 [Alkalilimnicola ehrlichii]|uniref:DUF4440 domain-containing protein n=1 Tax=Alkalilimnicola ehrlichii TaxID=351052 RepID=A0A3E0X0E8_9GAMM|nr:SgcJ/EcaC family oxidoreductase [Alkalilimnicola ehrlichii]RFA30953.1 hypothetical protein CAI21_02965 [Alkalilimnicola ehrlichii]RFA38904.1 hypothetical protein CAL65_03110 [Alkalilimnicola ehrlichii]
MHDEANDTGQPGEKEAEIRRVVQEMEAAFNRHDADGLVRWMAEDARWVNPYGRLLVGREEIRAVQATLLAGPLRERFARYHLCALAFPMPQVAIAHIRQEPTSATGEVLAGEPASIAVYVLVNDGDWRIATAQNTLIGAPSA